MKLGKPWVYGGCIGSHGQTMTILPGQTPCLRCVFEAAPAPGEAGTCETAGVLGPIVNIVASFQAAEAFKILTGQLDKVNRELIYIDVWENIQRRIKIAPLLGKVDCPCCQRRRFEWLDGEQGSADDELCAAATPCRCRIAPRPSSTSRRWLAISPIWARSLTTASCSSSKSTLTSSPFSPMAEPSSRAPATSTGLGRCMRATSAIDVLSNGRVQIMIYLDNAATSFPKPESVYLALDRFARESLANPGRAGHRMALASERMLEDTRHLLNQFFEGDGPERFIFTLERDRCPEHGHQGTGLKKAITSSRPISNTTVSAGHYEHSSWRVALC